MSNTQKQKWTLYRVSYCLELVEVVEARSGDEAIAQYCRSKGLPKIWEAGFLARSEAEEAAPKRVVARYTVRFPKRRKVR